MTGIILAGGKNTRMGRRNKAFLEVGGMRLIDRTVRLFRSVFREVIIVAADPLDYLDQQTLIVTDILPERGALGGVYTGLFYTAEEYAFIGACDMPFMNRAFLEYMVSRADGYDIIVPAPPDGLQPLHAVYARRCLPAIRSLLDRNRMQIKELYAGQRLLELPPEVLRSYDPEGRMFMNLNSPEDLLKLPPL
ncbi:MAG: molybdenum cofactor guanylyltransferase [Deltaproteobacteria bacterium]|nr:molybdenum cofactor guanylyltransferase [Deltaproteobacteria bacterium]